MVTRPRKLGVEFRESRRPKGVVVTDAKGDVYVARLGDGVEIVDGEIVATVGGVCDLLTAIDAGGDVDLVFTADGDYICVEDP
jgi:hypothetical protein